MHHKVAAIVIHEGADTVTHSNTDILEGRSQHLPSHCNRLVALEAVAVVYLGIHSTVGLQFCSSIDQTESWWIGYDDGIITFELGMVRGNILWTYGVKESW